MLIPPAAGSIARACLPGDSPRAIIDGPRQTVIDEEAVTRLTVAVRAMQAASIMFANALRGTRLGSPPPGVLKETLGSRCPRPRTAGSSACVRYSTRVALISLTRARFSGSSSTRGARSPRSRANSCASASREAVAKVNGAVGVGSTGPAGEPQGDKRGSGRANGSQARVGSASVAPPLEKNRRLLIGGALRPRPNEVPRVSTSLTFEGAHKKRGGSERFAFPAAESVAGKL